MNTARCVQPPFPTSTPHPVFKIKSITRALGISDHPTTYKHQVRLWAAWLSETPEPQPNVLTKRRVGTWQSKMCEQCSQKCPIPPTLLHENHEEP